VFDLGIPFVFYYAASKRAVVGLYSSSTVAKEIGVHGSRLIVLIPDIPEPRPSKKFGESFPPGLLEVVDNV